MRSIQVTIAIRNSCRVLQSWRSRTFFCSSAKKLSPLRFLVSAGAIEDVVVKARELLAQARAARELGGDLAYDDSGA